MFNENIHNCSCCGKRFSAQPTNADYMGDVVHEVILKDGTLQQLLLCDMCFAEYEKDSRMIRHMKSYYEYMVEDEQTLKKSIEEAEKLDAEMKRQNIGYFKKNKGRIKIYGEVHVGDPCYGIYEEHYAMRIMMAPGEYDFVSFVDEFSLEMGEEEAEIFGVETGHRFNTEQLGSFGIYLNGKIPAAKDLVHIGSVGVDSGVIGFFNAANEPNLQAWLDQLIDGKGPYITELGCGESCGDGGFGVYAYAENDQIVALEVIASYCSFRGNRD